jgi:hypothetical protein
LIKKAASKSAAKKPSLEKVKETKPAQKAPKPEEDDPNDVADED